MAEVVDVEFCHVHGYSHWDGEMDAVDTAPDDRICKVEVWPNVITLDPEDIHHIQDERMVQDLNTPRHVLMAGDLAFIRLFVEGEPTFVPCKVLAVWSNGRTSVKITADRGPYKRGTFREFDNPWLSLVARSQISRKYGGVRVNGSLAVITDDGRILRSRVS